MKNFTKFTMPLYKCNLLFNQLQRASSLWYIIVSLTDICFQKMYQQIIPKVTQLLMFICYKMMFSKLLFCLIKKRTHLILALQFFKSHLVISSCNYCYLYVHCEQQNLKIMYAKLAVWTYFHNKYSSFHYKYN